MGAAIAGSLIAAAASMAASKMNSDAQSRSANRIANASQAALEEYKKAYDKSFGNGSYNQQQQQMGIDASKTYADMLNNPELWNEYLSGVHAYQAPAAFEFSANDLYKDPSYNFRLKQGQDALAQNQVAGGLNLSGAAAKQMNDYTQNVASTEYANAYKRANDQYNTDRNFDYNAWLNDAKQYYANLASQLAGQNNLATKGIQANNNQVAALQGLTGNATDTISQVAAANNAASNADAQFMTNLINTLGNTAGTIVAQTGTAGDTPSSSNTSYNPYSGFYNPYTEQNATLLMNGYNPYLNSGMQLG